MPSRVSWGAIFAGAVVALSFWVLLFSLGLAFGLTSVEPGESIRGEALFTGIWSLVTPLVALFVGGLTAGWLCRERKMSSMLHGVTVWGLTTVLGVMMVFTLISTLATGVAAAGSGLISGASSAVSSAAGAAQGGGGMNVDANQLLGPINQRLQEQGKPQITAQGLQSAIQSSIQQSLQQGRLDAEIFERQFAANTNLSREDVRDVSQQITGQLSQGFQQGQQQVANVAAQGAEQTGKVFWGVFFALLLGLISSALGAVAGGAAGAKDHRRELSASYHTARTTTPTTPVNREVHP